MKNCLYVDNDTGIHYRLGADGWEFFSHIKIWVTSWDARRSTRFVESLTLVGNNYRQK